MFEQYKSLGEGYIVFWKTDSKLLDDIKLALKIGGFETDEQTDLEIDGKDAIELGVTYNKIYDEYEVKNALSEIAPIACGGGVFFRDTYRGFWRFQFFDGSLKEDEGDIYYDDDLEFVEKQAVKKYLAEHGDGVRLCVEDLPLDEQYRAHAIIEREYHKQDAHNHLIPYIESGDITAIGDIEPVLNELACAFDNEYDANVPDNQTWDFVIEEYIRKHKK